MAKIKLVSNRLRESRYVMWLGKKCRENNTHLVNFFKEVCVHYFIVKSTSSFSLLEMSTQTMHMGPPTSDFYGRNGKDSSLNVTLGI